MAALRSLYHQKVARYVIDAPTLLYLVAEDIIGEKAVGIVPTAPLEVLSSG